MEPCWLWTEVEAAAAKTDEAVMAATAEDSEAAGTAEAAAAVAAAACMAGHPAGTGTQPALP